jgi:translocation and assembly module TamA
MTPTLDQTLHFSKTIRCTTVLLMLILGLVTAPATRADTPRLRVDIAGVRGDLRTNVEAFLRLQPFTTADATLPSESRLRWLHQRASDDIRAALQPFGYYQPKIDAELTTISEGWLAEYTIDPGPALPLVELDIQIHGEGETDPAFQALLSSPELEVGTTLDQRQYERLRNRLQSLATERGYFDARFQRSHIQIDLDAYQATVIVHYDTQHRYQFGDVRFENSSLLPSFLERFIDLQPGQAFSATALQQVQSDLVNSGYFDQVMINASPDTAEDGVIPVVIDLTMRSRSKYTLGLGYATDTGPRARAGLERRWVNRRGHQFEAQALISQIRYGLGTAYTIPGADPRNDAYVLRARIDAEDSNRKDSITGVLGFSRRFQRGQWSHLLSLDYQWERFTAGSAQRRSTHLLIPSARSTWVNVDDRLQVRHGQSLTLELRGASEQLLSAINFAQGSVNGKWIHSFSDNQRLLLRAQAGSTLIDDDDFPKLPTSLRFYAGGDNSVRGYGLDSIGPRDTQGQVIGGRHLLVASIEVDHRFRDNWRVAAFVDVGDAFDNKAPDLRTGAGLGLRWQSPVGPVKVDLGHGFDEPGDDFRIHFSLGPEL